MRLYLRYKRSSWRLREIRRERCAFVSVFLRAPRAASATIFVFSAILILHRGKNPFDQIATRKDALLARVARHFVFHLGNFLHGSLLFLHLTMVYRFVLLLLSERVSASIRGNTLDVSKSYYRAKRNYFYFACQHMRIYCQ